MIFADQIPDGIFRVVEIALTDAGAGIFFCRIDDGCVENFARLVDDGELAAVIVAGVPAENDLTRDRRLHEKLLEILIEHLDSAVLCHVGQLAAELALDGRCDQALVAVLDRMHQNREGNLIFSFKNIMAEIEKNLLLFHLNLHGQKFFLLAAVDGEDAVAGDF